MELRGATVLLTGATGGLGQAIARALADRGATLVLTGRRVDVLEPLAKELDATMIAADLARADEIVRLVDEAGPIDVLVANAALPATGSVLDFTREEVDRQIDVNLRAPILLAVALAAPMVAAGHGHIVFMGSLAGVVASPRGGMYSATKFGVRGFAHGLRQDLHGTGVGVSVVMPGFVRDAGMFADADVPPLRGTRTVTPGAVAEATLGAIERDRAEVLVAPIELRIGAWVGAVAPGLAGTVQRLVGGVDYAERLSRAQRDKR